MLRNGVVELKIMRQLLDARIHDWMAVEKTADAEF